MLKFRHAICPVILMLCACNNNPKRSPVTTPADTTSSPAVTTPAPVDKAKTIIFFGNSLTAGYGLNPDQAFPAAIGRRLDSLHQPYKIVNAGVSGETSSGGKSRIDWVLGHHSVDIFFLELGANDGLRGIPVNSTRDNLQSIIDTVRHKFPACKIVLAGMLVPPSMGATYSTAFHDMFPYLAKRNRIILIPFLLQGVGGEPSLNQSDGIHPNPAGEKIVTETVWKAIQPLL